jgi:hypothetical protein
MRTLAVCLTVGALGAGAYRALTLVPTSHDFGKAGVQGEVYRVFRISGVTAATAPTLRAELTGRDSVDWYLQNDGSACWWPGRQDSNYVNNNPSPFPGTCDPFEVTFHPRTEGRKTAVLVVKDELGNRATAQLTGEAVAALCTNKVVFCNYAHLYSGTFNQTSNVETQDSYLRSTVMVTVTRGEAVCLGTQTQFQRNADPETVTKEISGPGLFAVEFLLGNNDSLKYRISFACPEPARRGEPGVPPTYASTATELNEAVMYAQDLLAGSEDYPAPEADPDNGVTGMVRTTWELRTRPLPPRPPTPPPMR